TYIPYLKSVSDLDDENKYNLSDEDSVANFIRSKPEAYCNTSDKELLRTILVNFDQKTTDFFRWKVEIKQLALSTLLKLKLGIDFGEVINLIPLERGKSGRIHKLKIEGTKRNFIVGKTLEIRRSLSEKHLYSSAFIVERVFDKDKTIPKKFILYGAGWGHGVGFCQIGGAAMASKGKKFDEILFHYFKGTELKKIY
ncbi:MAG: hypothetical protein N3A69_15045, partial [Leptospiraceae bacterium]|nr:hypothetical protein [Leptospiraceae bacterium]